MNMQVKKPDTSLSVVKYHQPALETLKHLYDEHRERLRAGNFPVADAWVKREVWKEALMSKLRINFQLATAIETSLLGCNAIQFGGSNTYVEFVTPPEEKAHIGYGHYFCHTCSNFKAVPARKYVMGEEVNFTIDGVRGLPATDVVGKVVMAGNPLTIEYKGKPFKRACENVTPVGTPPPLLYITSGRCWCPIDERGSRHE